MRTILLLGFLFSGAVNAQLYQVQEPGYIGITEGKMLGISGKKVFIYKENATGWDLYFELPLQPDSGTVLMAGDKTLSFVAADTVYFTDFSGKKIDQVAKNNLVKEFLKHGLQKLSFEDGTSGCFHWEKSVLSYTYRNGSWGSPEIEKTGRQRLPDWQRSIDADIVSRFVQGLDSILQHPFAVSLDDLELTERDYTQLKKEIRNQRDGKGSSLFLPIPDGDYNRVIGLVDSIKLLNPERLAKALSATEPLLSTNSNWKSVDLVNNKNQHITIYHNSYMSGNSYSPWIVTINGYAFTTVSMDITGFLNEVYPDFLKENDRKLAILRKLLVHSFL